MSRVQDWPIKLLDTVRDLSSEPFAWGQHDCFLMTAALVESVTGDDIAVPYRGRYDSAKSALQVLKDDGLDDLPAVVALHFTEIPPLTAQRGDIVLVEHEGLWSQSLAVCLGQLAVSTGPAGRAVPATRSEAHRTCRSFMSRTILGRLIF